MHVMFYIRKKLILILAGKTPVILNVCISNTKTKILKELDELILPNCRVRKEILMDGL